jgi:L-ascorbate oxidase
MRSLGLVLAVVSCLPIGAAAAQEEERSVENPPLLNLRRVTAAAAPGALETADAAGKTGEEVLDLNVVYTSSRLWNPAELRFDALKLRSYQGKGVDPKAPYVSPRLEVSPGDTIRITLNNQLPSDATCAEHGSESGNNPNTPHCFNGTNLHTHGLWVNPGGNGDNVLISINPGVSFQYEYTIPPDHPSGTFWYHTHRHGSTALQVSSGMAGALIVRGDRPPTPRGVGDLDTLLKPTPEQPFTERILVMQQIQYACRDAAGKIKTNEDGTYRCDPSDVGEIDNYDLFGPGAWRASGRYTSINGLVLPTFRRAKAGQIERWRVIHGGVRDTINLEIRKLKSDAADVAQLPRLKAADTDAYVGANCTGDPVPQFVVAADGLTMAAAQKKDQVVFQPAYR